MFLIKILIIINLISIINSQESCVTVSNKAGNCIPLVNCYEYYNLIKQSISGSLILTPDQIKTISNSKCGSPEQNKVCCPISTNSNPVVIQNTPSVQPILENQDYSSHPNAYLFQPNCGDTEEDKITNGNKTKLFQYTWTAIIEYQSYEGIVQNCGGSVITKRYILTAAHCITHLRGLTVHSVVLGEHDKSTERDCDQSGVCMDPIQRIPVEELIPHPFYNKREFDNDIALIRLVSDIQFSENGVIPICLPISLNLQNQNIKNVIISGWGITEQRIASPVLLQANLIINNYTHCSNLYKKSSIQIKPIYLCAGTGTSDSCRGDSGGPAFYPVNTQFGPRCVQYGIVSFGSSDCGANTRLPGIYTKVIPFMKWILDNMRD